MALPVINGNTLTICVSGITAVTEQFRSLKLEQFSAKVVDNHMELSFPVTPHVEASIPGVLHGARIRARERETPDPKPPTGGGTPPAGGTPGSTRQKEYTYTEARAA